MPVAERVLSELEIKARREQNESVLGTLAMEGLTLDPASAEIGRRFDQGQMSFEEFSSAMKAHVANLASIARQREGEGA
jgi:hypothetical protein